MDDVCLVFGAMIFLFLIALITSRRNAQGSAISRVQVVVGPRDIVAFIVLIIILLLYFGVISIWDFI